MKVVKSGANFPALEETILSFWEENKTFQKSNELRSDTQKFYSFYDGPPFANGLPHYGHLLANTIKDTVPRYWNMKGYHVERRFGWDCHGLPVEFEIEKREGLKGRTDILAMGVAEFNEKCRESVLHYADEWQKTIRRLGRWVDWDDQYRTMDVEFMESVWWVFSELYNKGLVYQGYKVVPYSPRITAVLSNFEANQNYKDVQDPAITVKFWVESLNAYALAWTTTPWTLISNLALCVGNEITYALIKDNATSEQYIVAEALLGTLYSKDDDYSQIRTIQGKDLVGHAYEPLFDFFKDHESAFKIIDGDFVSTDSGTGIVHCAPAYGEDDNRVCFEHGIGIVDPLDEEARFTSKIEPFAGKYVKDADKDIIRFLKEKGYILKHDVIVHSYPFCERTDEPLIYRTIPTWFVKVEEVKDQLLENNEQINWVPGHLKHGRMGKWLENARDWAVSRNRFWGTPIPIWKCSNDENHLRVLSSKADLEKLTGKKVDDLHKHFIDDLDFGCEQCNGTMQRVPEVFDCWFESGSMPYSQLHYPFENQAKFAQQFPADFIAEGLDQTRGWFYTLAVLSAALFKKPAFKNVVVNGLVLAEDGRKMSKRWRNYTAPSELISTYGADSVRLYMLNSAILRGEDLKFKDQGVKDTTRAVILPLWNAYSFLATYAGVDGWLPGNDLLAGKPPAPEGLLDQWILSKFQNLVASVEEEMAQYKLYQVVPVLVEFIDHLTNWYIRLSRRRFWAGSETMSQETREAYETLYYIVDGFIKVFAPFAPFISEVIYKHLHEKSDGVLESVHLCDMPTVNLELCNHKLEENMAMVRMVADLGRSLRAKHQIKTRQVLANMLIITKNSDDRSFILQTEDLIKSELNVKNIEFSTDEARYVKLAVKPNLKRLGKRLGKDLKAFRSHLDELNQDHSQLATVLNQIEQGKPYHWQEHDFELDDFLVERLQLDDRLIASSQGVTVLLDTKLTDELVAEGLAREVVNRIQNLRKNADFHVSDRINLNLWGDDELVAAVRANKEYVCGEVLASKIDFAQTGSVSKAVCESLDIEGKQLEVAVEVLR